MDVAPLVKQMHDNLSEIHQTVAGLSTEEHDARLDELEQKRDSLLGLIQANFDREKDEVEAKHQAEISAIKERRRIEDEEREARRRQEDEELDAKKSTEDAERQEKLGGEIKNVDDETEQEMDAVEEEARKLIEAGRERLRGLEEKRREINRLIDEQLKMPLPQVPSRKRVRGGKINGAPNGTPNGTPISMPVPSEAESRSLGNIEKAPEETATSPGPQSVEPPSREAQKDEEDEDEIVSVGNDSNVVVPQEVVEHEPKPEPEQEQPTEKPSTESTDIDANEAEQEPSDARSVNTNEESHMPSRIEDSAIGLDPNVEATEKDSQPASPSGNNDHDLAHNENLNHDDGDLNTHHNTSARNIENDMLQESQNSPIVESSKAEPLHNTNEILDEALPKDSQVEDHDEAGNTEDIQKPDQPGETGPDLAQDEEHALRAAHDPAEHEVENKDDHEAARTSDLTPYESEKEISLTEQPEGHTHEPEASETQHPVVDQQPDVAVQEETTPQSDDRQSIEGLGSLAEGERDTNKSPEDAHPSELEQTLNLPEVVDHDDPTPSNGVAEETQEAPVSAILSRHTTPVQESENVPLDRQQSLDVEEQPLHSQPEEVRQTPSSPLTSRPVTPMNNGDSVSLSQQSSPEMEDQRKKHWWERIITSAKKDKPAEVHPHDSSDVTAEQEPSAVRDVEQDTVDTHVPESVSGLQIDAADSEVAQSNIQSALNDNINEGEIGDVSEAQPESQDHAVESHDSSREPSDVLILHTSQAEQAENLTFREQDHKPTSEAEDSVVEDAHSHDQFPEVVNLAEGQVQEPPSHGDLDPTADEVSHGVVSPTDTAHVADDELDPNGLESSGGLGEMTHEPPSLQENETISEDNSAPDSSKLGSSIPISSEENSPEQEEEAAEASSIPNSPKISTSTNVIPEESASKHEDDVAESLSVPGSPELGASSPILAEESTPKQDEEGAGSHSIPSSPKLGTSISLPTEESIPRQEEESGEANSIPHSPMISTSGTVIPQGSSSELQDVVDEAQSISSSPKESASMNVSPEENDDESIFHGSHSPEHIIDAKNMSFNDDDDSKEVVNDAANVTGEFSAIYPHSQHEDHSGQSSEEDHVPETDSNVTSSLDFGENQASGHGYTGQEVQDVNLLHPSHELEEGHDSGDNHVKSHDDGDIRTTELVQHNEEDKQVGSSIETNTVADKSIMPNENLDEPLERESTTEPTEHPSPLSEQQSGRDIDQDHGVELDKETDPNPATGHELLEHPGSDEAPTDPAEADHEEQQSSGPLATVNSVMESITSTIAHLVPDMSSTSDAPEASPEDHKADIPPPEITLEDNVPHIESPELRLEEDDLDKPSPESDVSQSFVTPFESRELSMSQEPNTWEPDTKSDNHLSVGVPQRQASRSPLPVENDTVHGHEDLFDDDSASSYQDESDYYDHEDLHGDETITNDQMMQHMSSEYHEESPYGSNGHIREQVVEHTADDLDDGLDTAIPPAEYLDHAENQVEGGSLADSPMDRPNHQNGHSLASPLHESEQPTVQVEFPERQQFQYGDPETEDGAKTPSLVPIHHNNHEVSPFTLRHDTPNRGGLAASIHAPSQSAQAPSHQVEREHQPNSEIDSDAFMPRDVTNVPWHARSDSVPQSLHSQSTLSSAPSSPVHSALPIDKHEPVIRDSWPVSVRNGGRSRADTQFTDRTSGGEEFDPFKYDAENAPIFSPTTPSRTTEIHHPQPQSNRNSLSGSPMFHKLRSMFEPVTGGRGSAESSPTRSSRPTSTVFQPVARDRSFSLRKSLNLTDPDDSPRRGGFLNEREDEIDEHSALLQSTDDMDEN